jgi:hypothetical protein
MKKNPDNREAIMRMAKQKAEFWMRCNDLKTQLADIAIAVPEGISRTSLQNLSTTHLSSPSPEPT